MALTECKECRKEISDKAFKCPHCGVDRSFSKKLGTQEAITGVIVALGLIWWLASSDAVPKGSVGPTSSKAAEFSVSANELVEAYEANTVAADAKFKGHRFIINAKISDINTDFTGSPVLVLAGGVNQFSLPQAELAESERQTAAALKKGQRISLGCTGKGDIAKTPMMNECVIVN